MKSVTPVCELAFGLQGVPRTWAHSVLEDFKFMARSGASDTLAKGANFTTLQEWSFLVTTVGRRMYKVIAQISMHPLINSINGNCAYRDIDIEAQGTPGFSCEHAGCHAIFYTHQARALHAFRMHGTKNPHRLRVGREVFCLVCLKHFGSRERVINHLRRCKTCNLQSAISNPRITVEESIEIDKEEAEQFRSLQHKGCLLYTSPSPRD